MAFVHSPKIVTNGLVLALDAGNTKSYPGTGTTWFDKSGNAYNGTLTNGPTFNTGSGGSIVFDGVNDFVVLPNVGVSNLNAFSVSFWARAAVSSIANTVYSEGTPSSWASNLFVIYFGNQEDSGKCRVWFGYPTVTNPLIGTTVVTDNKWYYVTYNQTNTSNRTLSINGVVEATNTTTITSTSTNAYIGANNNNGNMVQFGKNSIGHLVCYNRALTQAEITQNFNALRGRFGI